MKREELYKKVMDISTSYKLPIRLDKKTRKAELQKIYDNMSNITLKKQDDYLDLDKDIKNLLNDNSEEKSEELEEEEEGEEEEEEQEEEESEEQVEEESEVSEEQEEEEPDELEEEEPEEGEEEEEPEEKLEPLKMNNKKNKSIDLTKYVKKEVKQYLNAFYINITRLINKYKYVNDITEEELLKIQTKYNNENKYFDRKSKKLLNKLSDYDDLSDEEYKILNDRIKKIKNRFRCFIEEFVDYDENN